MSNEYEIETIGGSSVAKVASAVEFIAENRHSLVEAARFISDHGDELLGVMDFMRDQSDEITAAMEYLKEHGDELLELVERIPDVLGRAGAAIAAAGHAAQAAGGFLTGEDGDDAANITSEAGNALFATSEHLDEVQGLLGGAISDVRGRAKSLAGIMKSLDTVGERLYELAQNFEETGEKLTTVGDDMESGGKTLAELGVSPASRRRSARAKARRRVGSTKRKPVARKTTKRKPVARKATKRKPAARKTTKRKPARKPSGLGDGVLKKKG